MEQTDILRHAVDVLERLGWARELGYLEIWQQIVAKVDAPDPPPGPGVP